MKSEEKLQRLLEMQEHPERCTDEEIRRLMADDECRRLYEQMVRAADAVYAEAELASLPNQERSIGKRLLRVAASFVALLMLSGITYAAIHIARLHQGAEVQTPAEVVAVGGSSPTGVHSSLSQDSIPEVRIFENVPLGEMVAEIARYHSKSVEVQGGQAHDLRLYYKWELRQPLESIVEDLNHFDRVTLAVEGDKVIIK